MACSPTSTRDAGYATAAAMVFAVGLGLITAAIVGRSIAQLRLARADLARTQAEYQLGGAHLQAAADIVRSTRSPPYHWAVSSEGGRADAWAAPEREKLSLAAAAHLDDTTLRSLGVEDGAELRARLAAAVSQELDDVGALDAAADWRRCASGFVSPFGEQTSFSYAGAGDPGPGTKTAAWRVGEAWRIRITTEAGWRDERIVRFTGDARHPAATVFRRLSRDHAEGATCDQVLRRLSGATTAVTP